MAQIAPFLQLDNDPYAVLSEGKLYWIQDAYTTSSYYPYSNPEWTEGLRQAPINPFDQSLDETDTQATVSANSGEGTESRSGLP